MEQEIGKKKEKREISIRAEFSSPLLMNSFNDETERNVPCFLPTDDRGSKEQENETERKQRDGKNNPPPNIGPRRTYPS